MRRVAGERGSRLPEKGWEEKERGEERLTEKGGKGRM